MRKYILVVFCLLTALCIQAQSVPRLTRAANQLFDNNRYLDATEYYEKIVSLDKRQELFEARYRLGICYLESLRYQEAEDVFKELGQINKPDNEYRGQAIYRHASILKVESNFEEADSLFAYVISISDDQDLIKLSRKQKEGCVLAMRQSAVDRGFTISLLEDVNSRYHDFGAVLNPSNDHLVLATTRPLGGYAGTQYEGALPDLTAFQNSRGRWRANGNAQRFDRLNTEWSEGAGSFTKDGTRFYFSTCRGESGAGCNIMVSNLVDGRWSDPEPLNEYINESGSENKQPFISATGDTLFFSSDRSGGYGGSDIWMSLRGLEPESWSPAINMGDVINSPEEDITPYYSSAFNCLIFASNGHVGYGGFDLYAAKGESFFEPEIYNLSAPFNSPLDDTYFNISDSLGFLASNREDRRILNLYSFNVPNEKLFLSLLISGESLIDGQVVSRFRDTRTLDLFAFRVEDYQGYELFAPEKRIKPKPSVIAKKEAEATQPLASKSSGGLEDYMEEAATESYFSNASYTSRAANSIDFEHVYFRYGSAGLEPAAKQAIKELVAQIQGMNLSSIEILAYTDIDGSAEFNQKLSEKRGMVLLEYMIQLGIPEDLIVVRARGEGPLSNRTSWYSKMFSRRAEIIVNSDQPIQLNRAKPYAVRYERTFGDVAGLLGIDPAGLKQWNTFAKDTVEAGSIIRIGEELQLIPNIRYFLEEEDLRNSFFMYTVKPNETLTSIAEKYNTVEELIAEVNHVSNDLKAGDEIFIYRVH